jgi:hypothetical protein
MNMGIARRLWAVSPFEQRFFASGNIATLAQVLRETVGKMARAQVQRTWRCISRTWMAVNLDGFAHLRHHLVGCKSHRLRNFADL